MVVVPAGLARLLWPDGRAVGRALTFAGTEGTYEVVGVVADIRHTALDKPPRYAVYEPYGQHAFAWNRIGLVVETAGPPGPATFAAIRRALSRTDPLQALATVVPLDDVVGRSLREERFRAYLVAIFAGVGLLLGVVGIYGVVSYSAQQQVREMALRLALGASQAAVVGLVLRRALVPAALGIALGGLASTASGRLLDSVLYGVTTLDLATLAGVGAAFMTASVSAALLPALRAARGRPDEVLRAG